MDLDHPASIVKEAASKYPVAVRKQALQDATEAYRTTIDLHNGSRGPSALRDALEASLAALRKSARKQIAKTQADTLAAASSNDVDWVAAAPTPAQADASSTRSLQTQRIVDIAAQRVTQFGGDPNDVDAMAPVITATARDYSGGNNESFEELSATSAARARESGFAWPADLADPRQVQAADEINAALRPEGSNGISGRRNDPRATASTAPDQTGFSGPPRPSFPAGVAGGVAKRAR